MGVLKNEIGNRYHRLLVLYYAYTKNKKIFWMCQCDCGKIIPVEGNKLRSGHTQSCGCLQSERTSANRLGWKPSDKTKTSISNTLKGRKLTQEHKVNISNGLKGEKSYAWKGGLNRTARCNEMGRMEYRDWRRQVFTRDHFTCQICEEVGGKLNAHHIEPWKSNIELRYSMDNGITLCKRCHLEVHRKK